MYKIIRNAHILTLDADHTEFDQADILINGSVIEAIGPNLELPHDAGDADVIDALGFLAMPGLINAHFHSTSAFMKGALEGLPLEPYMLYEAPIDDQWETKRIYYLRSMLTAIDMLKIGITSVRDDAHFFSHPTSDLVDGVFEAFQDAGMRASVGLGISNVPEIEKLPFLRQLITDSTAALLPDATPKRTDELLDLYQSVTDRWHGASAGRLHVHGSCSAPQRVTPEYLQALSDFCTANDMSLDMHMLETKTQRVHGDLEHGRSFVRYVSDLGALTDNTVLIHCVWVDDQDMDLIAAANAVVAHNPVSNLRLGSGVMPFNAMTKRGIDICLGTDEPSVEETSNLWINAKTGALLQKIGEPEYDNWPTAAQFLTTICNGGARAMRQTGKVGSLESGKQADIILLDLNSASFTPRNDLSRHLVYAETGSSVRLTMVAGDVVYKDGDLLLINEDDIKAEINDFWPDYRHSCDRANEKYKDLVSTYKAVCKRSAEVDVGFSRWLSLR